MVRLPPFLKTRYARFATVISLVVLAGCAGTQPLRVQTQVNPITIPAAQQQCPAIPIPPDPDDPNTTQRDVALYIADLTKVAEQCKYDLITINKIIDEYNALAEKPNL